MPRVVPVPGDEVEISLTNPGSRAVGRVIATIQNYDDSQQFAELIVQGPHVDLSGRLYMSEFRWNPQSECWIYTTGNSTSVPVQVRNVDLEVV